MDRTLLTLAADSSQVGTAAAAFERMVGAGNAAAAAGGKVTTAATAQGKVILTTLVPAATKGKTAFNERALQPSASIRASPSRRPSCRWRRQATTGASPSRHRRAEAEARPQSRHA